MKYCIIAVAFLFAGCAPKLIPTKGLYPSPPISFHSDRSIEKVWDNLIDIFAQKGFSIRIIDKSSGLIISDKVAVSYSIEDKNGKLKDPRAFVVLPAIISPATGSAILPVSVKGEWNVRLKPDGTGTTINVNLLNFTANYGQGENSSIYFARAQAKYAQSVDGRTTGVFEKILADEIK